jgi:heterodisulfide reductase subunit C2
MADPSTALSVLVRDRSHQDPQRCYQCGNCTAGCPVAGQGDLLPHQVFRRLQLGDDEPLRALQPWLCVGCQTCAARCPQELDLSRVMDALRAEAVARGTVPAAARSLLAFQQSFLEQILSRGRLSEVELGVVYNLRTRNPLQNAGALPALFARGKIRLDGKKVRGPGQMRRGRDA